MGCRAVLITRVRLDADLQPVVQVALIVVRHRAKLLQDRMFPPVLRVAEPDVHQDATRGLGPRAWDSKGLDHSLR